MLSLPSDHVINSVSATWPQQDHFLIKGTEGNAKKQPIKRKRDTSVFFIELNGSQMKEGWLFLQNTEVGAFLGNAWRSNFGSLVWFYVFNIQWSRAECWVGIKDWVRVSQRKNVHVRRLLNARASPTQRNNTICVRRTVMVSIEQTCKKRQGLHKPKCMVGYPILGRREKWILMSSDLETHIESGAEILHTLLEL